ncbi:MAG TPA: FmdB family zinc ribbon protein [Humibacter sp.]|nr:FmdB family zinc ribbon protein [Humibacter sp.]
MPTYSYKCTECGHAFDIHQAFSDDALTTCPECGGPLRKVFGAVGVTFKGSGFYRTDSRAGSSQSVASGKNEPTGPKSDQSTSGTKSESKGSSEKKSAPAAPSTGSSGSGSAA